MSYISKDEQVLLKIKKYTGMLIIIFKIAIEPEDKIFTVESCKDGIAEMYKSYGNVEYSLS